MDITSYYSIVEQAISRFGINPNEFASETPGVWKMKRGSAKITVEIYLNNINQLPYCRVYSPVMELPQENLLEFYRELLEINMMTVGASFGITNQMVFIKSDREAEGLDVTEMYLMLMRVGSTADDLDDELKNKYNVKS